MFLQLSCLPLPAAVEGEPQPQLVSVPSPFGMLSLGTFLFAVLPAATSYAQPQRVNLPFAFGLLTLGMLRFAVVQFRSFGSPIVSQTAGCMS